MIFGTLSFRVCGGLPLALVWNIWVKSQMPTALEHAFIEKSTKLLIFLPLRTIYFRTFQCETTCTRQIVYSSKEKLSSNQILQKKCIIKSDRNWGESIDGGQISLQAWWNIGIVGCQLSWHKPFLRQFPSCYTQIKVE